MKDAAARRRIWGWFFFDWASQPYNTLLLTFIFAPYMRDLLGDGAKAQAAWGYGVGAAGVIMALLAPVLGAMADTQGSRMRWIWIFSGMYVLGSAGLWLAAPGDFNLVLIMVLFGIGLIGMEFATIFTNAMLPDLGPPEEISRISGNGWAFGYLGGLLALVLFLAFFNQNAETGLTLLGQPPAFGLDAATMEGTRIVGPATALWFMLFMIPFFLFVRDPRPVKAAPGAVKAALQEVVTTIRSLPARPSLFAFLGGSMLYRDALNGMFIFGGIYASGVLGWGTQQTGIFGIIAIITSALSAFLGGRADAAFGSKTVIKAGILFLSSVAVVIIFISRDSVLGIPVAEESRLPDYAFFVLGGLIGVGLGALQSSSRTMMCKQADPERMTEAFGLYALSGKATSFLAPLSIGIVTDLTGSQQLGITPLVVLFLSGLFLLRWVRPQGDHGPA